VARGGEESPSAGSRARGDLRPYTYAAIDAVLAAVYAVVVFVLAPSRAPVHQLWMTGLVVAAAAMAIGTVTRRRWGWRVAIAGAASLLALSLLALVLLALSAAFLTGVYGAFGRGAAALVGVAALLVIELVALVPGLQLRYLLSRAGRERFGVARPGRG
jgi:hypothetical protein